ncbi:MAG: two-component system response regulator [Pedosphaera sp.]|nr:two-component system response regulator [Pedosphaera sp.]
MKENVILLVEDSTEDASLVLGAFKKWGINNPIQVVTDGERAVDYLSGQGEFADRELYPLPCLALLDLHLPQMTGFEVLQWVRARHDLDNVPVVVLSGTKDPAHFDEAHRLGANACVVKSLELAALYELIQHLNYFSLASDYNATAVPWSPEP